MFLSVLALTVSAQAPAVKDSVTISDHLDLSNPGFVKVEVESHFRGGLPGWSKFLGENLVYPKKAIRRNVQGTVILQFIVDKDGTVGDIEAIGDPELLREAAVDIIKKSPN